MCSGAMDRHLEREDSKIQATEMKFLRAIMGKINSDRIINALIREELTMEEIHNHIEKNTVRWF
jgi:hypothetical protein